MKRFLFAALLLLGFVAVSQAQYVKVLGIASQSGKIITSGVTSTTSADKTFPGATVTVYSPSGSGTVASLFSASTGTVKANPFSASLTDATIDFFIAPGSTFDIRISGVSGGVMITPFTRSGYTAPGTTGLSLALCGGTADTALLSALNALGGTIQIPKGITCASNSQTLSASLQIDNGGFLKPITGQTITLTGPQPDGAWQRFTNALSGQGAISFAAAMTPPQVYAAWWGAKNDRTTSVATNNAAIQRAVSSLSVGGSVIITFGTRWNISGVTVPNYTTIFDYSGYYPADDPTFNGGFTAGPRVYVMNDVTSPPTTNAGNEFSILSAYHPALILDNIGATRRASVILRRGGATKWQVGNSIDGATDDHFHITSYTINPTGTTVLSLDQATGALGLNAGVADAGSTLDLNSRAGDFVGLFQSHTASDNVEFRFIRGATDDSMHRMFTILANQNTVRLAYLDSGNLSGYSEWRGAGASGNPNQFILATYGDFPVVFRVGDVEAARFAATNRNLLVNTTTDNANNLKVQVNGGIQVLPSQGKPTCSVTTRGSFWVTSGGAGVKDNVEVCAKDAADAYAWRTIY